MTLTDAVLWTPHPALLLERAGGLSVVERQLFVLARAGLRRVWVGTPRPEGAGALRLPPGLEVRWGSLGGGAAAVEPPYLGVSGDHFIRREALEAALAAAPDRPTSFQDAGGRGVLQVMPARPEDGAALDRRPLPDGACVLLTLPLASGPAAAWLMAGAAKATDGFMARHFDRRISLAVTRRLLDTPVTPNQMTAFSTAVGLAGAGLMARGSTRALAAGSLLVWLHSTLDGCDGELARLRFQESPLGGVMDFWGDNLVHAALFLGLGLGLSRARGAAWPLALGAVASASAMASAGLAFAHNRRRARRRKAEGPFFSGVAEVGAGAAASARRLAAVEDALAQRDFIYLLVALAALGHADWFLWASALGSPLFLAVLLWLRRGGD